MHLRAPDGFARHSWITHRFQFLKVRPVRFKMLTFFLKLGLEYADIIIPNNKFNTVAVDIVKTIINQRL